MRCLIIRIITIALLAIPCVYAKSLSFDDWICTVWNEAKDEGIDEDTLVEAFPDGMELRHDLIERERQQIRSKITLNEYVKQRQEVFKKAPGHYAQHAALLKKISAKYQVPPRFIIALWGMESRFGTFCGKTPIIPALATLAYASRRKPFFRKELLAALRMVHKGHVDLKRFMGAWDGGLGQCQFMPTSFWRFAVDEDGDGKMDIFSSTTDVFASIANYLHKHGWEAHSTWGREVKLPPKFNSKFIDAPVKKPVHEWAKLGVRCVDSKPLPKSAQLAWIVRKPFTNGRVFLVYKNFHVLKKWNNSTLYAITTGMLADKIH